MAILLYLNHKYRAATHWYPTELQARARVDEYLAWQHTAVQLPACNVYLCKVRLPALVCGLGQEPEPPPVLERTRWPIYASHPLSQVDIRNLSQHSFPRSLNDGFRSLLNTVPQGVSLTDGGDGGQEGWQGG